MLTISKPLSATQAQNYHAKEFTAAEQNYWKRGQNVEGEWHGQLAEKFGLIGSVGSKEFAWLSEGQHPRTEEQLVRHRAVHKYQTEDGRTIAPVEHRAGWDATFSAPKSVSLAALVGGDDRVREAHREAVNVALNELERYTQARIGGNHAAETTGRFVVAKFEHDTARPVDGYAAPQLHTHSVIFNMTDREDGSLRALQPRGLFETQAFATAVYQSHLTYRLRNLGYEIEAGKSGAPEIRGFTREYLDASSLRRRQIEDTLARNGMTGPEAAEIAAHNTRDRKQILSPAEVMAAHRQIANEFGNQADKVVAEARTRSLGHTPKHASNERQQRTNEFVTYARDRGFEREAVTDERRLFVDALRRGMGKATYPEVRAAFESRVASGEFRAVAGGKHATGRQFTTAATIQAERQIVQRMQEGRSQFSPILSIQRVIPLTDAHPHLNPAQRAAIEQALVSRDRMQAIQGVAGAGKTTTLQVIREGAELGGYAVEGFAPTSRAARQLREAGIPAETLQGFLARSGRQRPGDPNDKHLYMLDESSLASTKQMRGFLEKIGPFDRVLLVGDIRQHQGVDAGKPFEQLQQAGMSTVQLDRIVRQKDPELLKAVEHFAKHETAQGMALLERQERILEIADPKLRYAAIAKEYAIRPESTLIVSPDNVSRIEINRAVRAELQARGAVDRVERTIHILTPRSDMTGADRAWAANYNAQDTIYYQRGSKEFGIEPKSYAQVIAVHAKENLLTVKKANGERVIYDPSRLRGIQAFKEVEREFSIGDRIQFTAPNKQLGVANRDLDTIEQIGNDGRVTVRMAAGNSVSFDSSRMRHFDHGYAVTSHSAQGLTARRVLVNVDTSAHPELVNARFAYVAVSRGSQDARLFTNDTEAMTRMLARDSGKSSALEMGQAISAKTLDNPRPTPGMALSL